MGKALWVLWVILGAAWFLAIVLGVFGAGWLVSEHLGARQWIAAMYYGFAFLFLGAALVSAALQGVK